VEGIVTHLANEISKAEEAGLDPSPLREMLSSMAAACPLSLKVTLRRMQTADQPLPEELIEAMRESRMTEEELMEAREQLQETMKAYIEAEAESLGITALVPALEKLLLKPPERRKVADWTQLMQKAVACGVDVEALAESLQALMTESHKEWLELAQQERLLTNPPEEEEDTDGSRLTMIKSLADTLRQDFQLTQHFLNNANFLEGVCTACPCRHPCRAS
jgi:hypothetical protein